MACHNTAPRLHQVWDGGDGKSWIDVACGTTAGHITYLCLQHKLEQGMQLQVPSHFKQDFTQREMGNQIFEAARNNGTELQKA